jgi:hypothetical protein
MRKLTLILAIALIASPTFALTIYLQREGTSNIIDVNYSGADVANPPRSFALDVTITSPSLFTNVTNYGQGESNSVKPCYGIYPARIDINTAGIVQSWGSPLADLNDPGAGTGLPSNHIVLEFSSLYYNDINAPVTSGHTSGRLCSLTINPNGATGSLNIRVQGETTYRGGVVLEDGTQVAVDVNSAWIPCLAMPSKATNPSPANGATGVARVGTSLAWTAGSGGCGGSSTSHDVYFGTAVSPPFIQNQPGTSYTIPGTMAQGKVYYWRIDEKSAGGTMTGDVWSFTVEECIKSSATEYAAWVSYGKPACWCYKRQCRGDGNGQMTLSKPVTASDLANFQASFNLKWTQMLGKADLNGTMLFCGDYNHSQTLGKPVTGSDLIILQTYFNLKYTSVPCCDLNGDCVLTPADKYLFWTN